MDLHVILPVLYVLGFFITSGVTYASYERNHGDYQDSPFIALMFGFLWPLVTIAGIALVCLWLPYIATVKISKLKGK